LDHKFYTDVVSFDLSSTPEEILADIYISADRIRDNAKNLGLTIRTELHRVMFHGLLHLCGYNDKTEKQRKLMRKKEDFYVDLYFGRFT
jgi:probable rRNA maturation factor